MRLRSTLAATVGAFALVLTLPTSANAADGTFTYQYADQSGELTNPPSGECITLPEVADEQVLPAHTPGNATDAVATVYAGSECTGPQFDLRAHTGHGSDRLKVRSVVFH
ncbi:hypothetical protein AR457_24235 [Streptomyces agglomeratus]|uniref:hypothetical protein n=1 Tax=Streptomyces agglomeratus TaxID=285458 RepID=UPI000854E358|nr:hypothetical protein [Streptomyces agglomeratus]OEJ38845.1 hypothetical protein BGK70_12420 [Streptomyces agglomeratus]OEJ46772.1 hypothetical protein AR457_24235 [Streptomyces agglomeratus]OEJ51375.1 hypothetical protein BGK72_11900 [Streptomyces agglomeratus]OEJ58776.1 hypothetical protein BGM19_13000 [Streptomyces agglomeratus]